MGEMHPPLEATARAIPMMISKSTSSMADDSQNVK
jgi:hypothetical protein